MQGQWQQQPQPQQQQAYGAPPQAPSPYGAGGTPPQGDASAPAKSFVKSLFDFKFESFIAPRLLGILYGIFLIGLVLVLLGGIGSGLMAIISGATSSYGSGAQVMQGIMVIGVTPFAVVLYLLIGRMYFEIMAVMFRGVALLESINNKPR